MRKVEANSLAQRLLSSDWTDLLKELPQAPGVYFLKGRGRAGTIEYVGGSGDLRSQLPDDLCCRLKPVVDTDDATDRSRPAATKPTELTYVVTGSVLEAELLELDLIRHYRPEVNVRKDRTREAGYLHIDTKHRFPVFHVSRRYPDANEIGFGPFFDPDKLRRGLEVARRVLQLRYCTEPFPPPDHQRCIRYRKQHCAGPCRGMISPPVYRQRLQRLVGFLRGDDERLLEDVRRTYRSLPPEETVEFDAGAHDLLDIRHGLLDLVEPTDGARLLVTPPTPTSRVLPRGSARGGNGRVTVLLFRRGRIIDRLRTYPDPSCSDRLAERMKSALMAHQSDPVGLLRPEELSASRVVKRHISAPEPGEHIFQVPSTAELPRLVNLALRECERTAARTH